MEQQGRKVDIVAPAATPIPRQRSARRQGADAILDADGVTPADGTYHQPTRVFDEGIAGGIPSPACAAPA